MSNTIKIHRDFMLWDPFTTNTVNNLKYDIKDSKHNTIVSVKCTSGKPPNQVDADVFYALYNYSKLSNSADISFHSPSDLSKIIGIGVDGRRIKTAVNRLLCTTVTYSSKSKKGLGYKSSVRFKLINSVYQDNRNYVVSINEDILDLVFSPDKRSNAVVIVDLNKICFLKSQLSKKWYKYLLCFDGNNEDVIKFNLRFVSTKFMLNLHPYKSAPRQVFKKHRDSIEKSAKVLGKNWDVTLNKISVSDYNMILTKNSQKHGNLMGLQNHEKFGFSTKI